MDINGLLVILMMLSFIGLLFTGYPIAFVLGGVAMFFTLAGYCSDQWFGTVTGLDYMVIGIVVNRLYKVLHNWILIALPMFIFMGLMLDQSGIAQRMMRSMQDLFGKVRGGLAISVTLIGILLAAATGIIGASVVLLGLLSVPAMLEQKYSKTLAVGTVCASGTLGILIPPSIMLVMMADQLSLAVGDLFMGALLPGIILGILYIFYILILALIFPDSAPLAKDRRELEFSVIWEVIKTILPTAALILAVLGSIFAGLATPTEASGIGAMGAVILALVNKKLNVNIFRQVLQDTFNTTGYIFGILVGATCFALVLRELGGDEFIAKAFTGLPFGPYGVIAVILGVVFLLGFFLDWIEITLIILPILAPVVSSLGFHIEGAKMIDNPELVWFAILVAITLQTSFLTPPVGFAIFYLKGVTPPQIKLMDIYKGVIPFIILQLTGLLIVMLWPQLVIWLPSIAYG
ncbi:MAG: TRAP transporter large permease subunit [Proteobacteria bacterium]|nr:TRAP transporter large permease subunit [Pseudomonadota bacterium]MBU1584916.1 TRAP transporter large permease subunit [Pseudomonadota bacterium]MBU2456271.1 TRAP transporter large permease subunit [Pseudomonadota bacterium]